LTQRIEHKRALGTEGSGVCAEELFYDKGVKKPTSSDASSKTPRSPQSSQKLLVSCQCRRLVNGLARRGIAFALNGRIKLAWSFQGGEVMATKLNGWCGKFAAVVFTSIVAPVLVNLVTRDTTGESGKRTWNEPALLGPMKPIYSTIPAARPFPLEMPSSQLAPATAPPVEVVRVVAHGSGHTHEAALQEALSTALRQVLAAQLDTETWSRKGTALCVGVLHRREGLILGWKDLGTRKEWGLRGPIYHEEIAVEVNLRALLERLRG
jgi:hypothetical protein